MSRKDITPETQAAGETLARLGKAMFANAWMSELARQLGVRADTVPKWVVGSSRIPPAIWSRIALLADERRVMINKAIVEATPYLMKG